MGNVPSKEPQGRPLHKLSKPRITSYVAPPPGSSTSNGLPVGPSPPLDPNPDLTLISIPYSATATNNSSGQDDDDDDDNDDGNRNRNNQRDSADKSTFLVPPKAQRRLSLFRSKSSQETSSGQKSRRSTVIGSPTLPPSEGRAVVGRANTVSTHRPLSELPSGLPITQK